MSSARITAPWGARDVFVGYPRVDKAWLKASHNFPLLLAIGQWQLLPNEASGHSEASSMPFHHRLYPPLAVGVLATMQLALKRLWY